MKNPMIRWLWVGVLCAMYSVARADLVKELQDAGLSPEDAYVLAAMDSNEDGVISPHDSAYNVEAIGQIAANTLIVAQADGENTTDEGDADIGGPPPSQIVVVAVRHPKVVGIPAFARARAMAKFLKKRTRRQILIVVNSFVHVIAVVGGKNPTSPASGSQ